MAALRALNHRTAPTGLASTIIFAGSSRHNALISGRKRLWADAKDCRGASARLSAVDVSLGQHGARLHVDISSGQRQAAAAGASTSRQCCGWSLAEPLSEDVPGAGHGAREASVPGRTLAPEQAPDESLSRCSVARDKP